MRDPKVRPNLSSGHFHQERGGTLLKASWVAAARGRSPSSFASTRDARGRSGPRRGAPCRRDPHRPPQVLTPAGRIPAAVSQLSSGPERLKPTHRDWGPSFPHPRADLGTPNLAPFTPRLPTASPTVSSQPPLLPGASISRICRIPIKHLGEISAAYK